jgi:hypothetical protein
VEDPPATGQRGDYGDLLDIPRHLAALQRWDDIAGIADQAARGRGL